MAEGQGRVNESTEVGEGGGDGRTTVQIEGKGCGGREKATRRRKVG